MMAVVVVFIHLMLVGIMKADTEMRDSTADSREVALEAADVNDAVNECLTTRPCKNSATCIDLPQGYRCTCVPGYNGTNCEQDINECATTQPCKNGAKCTNLPGSYRCTCAPGYRGLNCNTDINECSTNNGGCSHKCTNTLGSFACSCPDPELNLAPDNRMCVASGVSVNCLKNKMSVTLPKALLLGLSREYLSLKDASCTATETKTHYTLSTSLIGCGTTSKSVKGAVVYSNTILEVPIKGNAIVTREREIEIPFSCFYKNSGDAIAVGVRPDTRKLVFGEEGKGNFTVAMDMFPNKNYLTSYKPSEFPVVVKLRKELFFQASVETSDKQLSVLAENCYATPSQDRNDASKYQLIKDGCAVDDTTVVISSAVVGTSRFSTEAFKFIADHPFVFVHCHIRICEAANKNSRCAQGCVKTPRKRRDIGSDDKLYPLAQGPLTMAEDDKKALGRRAPTINGVTLASIAAMVVLSAICVTGMAYLARKKSYQPRAYPYMEFNSVEERPSL